MPALRTNTLRARRNAALVAAAIGIGWISNPVHAAPEEEALLIAKDAKGLFLLRHSDVYRQISYTMDLEYPARAIGEPQWKQLRNTGWVRCRSLDPNQEAANYDWVDFIDGTVTPERIIHQHLTHWLRGDQMITISLRYYSARHGSHARPDNTEQHVDLIFEDGHGREAAEWLRVDCSK